MTFKDHFSKLAAQYSAFRPTYPPALFDLLANLCNERLLAWDCGCGSGQATVPLAEYFEAVIATDASPQQIAAAPAHDNVTYRVAPAEASGLEASCIDLLTVSQALHWFDLDTFYVEAQRVLKPAGVIAAWTYGPLHVDGAAVDELVQEFYYQTVYPYWPKERKLVEAEYRGIPFPFAEIQTPPLTLHMPWDRAHLLGYLRTWSATARYVEVKGTDPVAELEQRLATHWTNPDEPRTVTWPLALRVGRRQV